MFETARDDAVMAKQKGRAVGPLEARLQSFDLLVLGGLNEGTWPVAAGTDPWLSRPMRAQLGLESPERRIGLAAHDFATLAWKYAMDSEFADEPYPRDAVAAASKDVEDARAIMSQLPGGALSRWQESLSESDDAEEAK